jgi:polyhydroxyalkanoate synthesis regulator protein
MKVKLLALIGSLIIPLENVLALQTDQNTLKLVLSGWVSECSRFESSIDLKHILEKNIKSELKETLKLEKLNELVSYYWDNGGKQVWKYCVEDAINRVKEQTSVWENIKSIFGGETAKKKAEQVVKAAFKNPQFQAFLQNTTEKILREEFSKLNDNLQQKLSDEIKECLGLALEEKTGKITGKLLRQYITYKPPKSIQHVNNLALDYSGGPGLMAGGVAVYSMRRILASQFRKVFLKRMEKTVVKKVSMQIAKRLVAKFVLGAVEIVGFIWTAWDLYKIGSGDAFFNALKEGLLSEETQAKIKSAIATQLKLNLDKQIGYIASNLAQNVTVDFKIMYKRYKQAEVLIESHETLSEAALALQDEPELGKAFLDLVLLANKYGFLNQLKEFAANMQKLKEILLEFEYIKPMIINLRNLDLVYAWVKKVDKPSELLKIVDLEIYKYFKPEELTHQDLEKLLKFKSSYTLKMAVDTLGKEKLLELLNGIDAYNLSRLESRYGASFLDCSWKYYKENPKSLYYLTEVIEGHMDLLCKDDTAKYAKENPKAPVLIADAYDHRGFLSSITTFFKALFGPLPMGVYKELYPKAFWVIAITLTFGGLYLALILLGVISTLVSSKASQRKEG